MNALDELCPSFPERGALFGRQLRLRLGFGVLLAGERLQGEVFPFSKGARSRGVGAHVVDAVLPRFGDLREDSGQELEDIEGLALRIRSAHDSTCRKRELSPQASTRVDTEAESVRRNLAEIPSSETLALVTAGVNGG